METPTTLVINSEMIPDVVTPPEPEGYVWAGNPYLLEAPRTMWRQSPRLKQYTDGGKARDASTLSKSRRLHVLLSGTRDEAWLYEEYMQKFAAMKSNQDSEWTGTTEDENKLRTFANVNRDNLGLVDMIWDEFNETNSSADCYNYEMNKEEFAVWVSKQLSTLKDVQEISEDPSALNAAMSAGSSQDNQVVYPPEKLDAAVANQPPPPPSSPPSDSGNSKSNSNNSSYWKVKHIINCT